MTAERPGPVGRPPWWSVAGAAILAVALYVGLPQLLPRVVSYVRLLHTATDWERSRSAGDARSHAPLVH